jgi:hypothetical protein
MAYVTEAEVRLAAARATQPTYKSAATLLRESRDTVRTTFDVFLSHSYVDQELVLGAKQLLEEKGLTVYVDWINDPLLDRREVTRATAEKIRGRMRQCRTLLYLHSVNATRSKWCPWELGYFDAFSHPGRRVFIFPVTGSDRSYTTQEYLNLYDTVDIASIGVTTRRKDEVRVKDATGSFKTWSVAA